MVHCRSIIRVFLISGLISGCAAPQRTADESPHLGVAHGGQFEDPAITHGARYTEWLFSDQIDSLWYSLSEQGRDRFPHPDSLRDWRAAVTLVVPGFEQILADSVERTDTVVTVWRFGVNERDGAAYYVRWRLAPDDYRVRTVRVWDAGREAATPMLYYEPRTRLRLPFEGEWIIFWGGRTVQENYHAAYPHQRFAMDLFPTPDSATIFRAVAGEPTQLTDFACFGAEILAPAAGEVVASVDTVPDSPLGRFHPTSELGNHIVIEHLPTEYSLLAHLKHGSLRVSVGESVRAGDVIAQCGNSGRTTAPHLHYDLRTSPQVVRGTYSLPARFYSYYADSLFVEMGEPRRWQRIQPAR